MKYTLTVMLVLGALVLGACGQQPAPDMENPASKYCVDQGGKWESRTEESGEVGYCLFDDGSECEEWAYYRGQCGPGGEAEGIGMPNPASVHCDEEGGKLEIRDEAGGEVGYCIFDDGSECEEWAFYRGDCAPGGSTP
jgi:putative hemolysin